MGQADPTNARPINFTVVFSEAVTGFATGDVTLTGTAGGTLTGTVTGGPTTYNVAVTGMTTPGTVVATIAAGVAADAAGNGNAASTSTDNAVTWDNVAPVATIALQAASDTGASNSDNLTNAATLVFDVTFSESVTGLDRRRLLQRRDIHRLCLRHDHRVCRRVDRDGEGCSQGTVIVRLRTNAVVDAAGNQSAQTDGPTVTIDRTAPTVTINQAVGQADPTNASPISFTADFSEQVTGFATGDVTFAGTAGGTKTGTVTGGPTTTPSPSPG